MTLDQTPKHSGATRAHNGLEWTVSQTGREELADSRYKENIRRGKR